MSPTHILSDLADTRLYDAVGFVKASPTIPDLWLGKYLSIHIYASNDIKYYKSCKMEDIEQDEIDSCTNISIMFKSQSRVWHKKFTGTSNHNRAWREVLQGPAIITLDYLEDL